MVAHCLSVELEDHQGHDDTMLDPERRIWGFETNFGGLAELALVKSNQLMPKPAHLTWEESACPGLVNSTANYREAWEANRLIAKGLIHPTLSRTYPLTQTGDAACDVHRNLHQGKVGVLCLAPTEGLGVRDPERRARHLPAINRFRDV